MSKYRYVIYDEGDKYCFTSEVNYNSRVQNARLIYKFDKNKYTLQDVIDTFTGYGSLTKDDIIVKTKEEN